jgi:hypothetical protein
MIVEAQGLQEFSEEIRSLMAVRRMTGRDDFGRNVYLLYMFPQRLRYPRIEGARVLAEHELFTLFQLPAGVAQGSDAVAVSGSECNAN